MSEYVRPRLHSKSSRKHTHRYGKATHPKGTRKRPPRYGKATAHSRARYGKATLPVIAMTDCRYEKRKCKTPLFEELRQTSQDSFHYAPHCGTNPGTFGIILQKMAVDFFPYHENFFDENFCGFFSDVEQCWGSSETCFPKV